MKKMKFQMKITNNIILKTCYLKFKKIIMNMKIKFKMRMEHIPQPIARLKIN